MYNIRRLGLGVVAGAILSLGQGVASFADASSENADAASELRRLAEEKLGQTFANFNFFSIEESAIPGMYQIDAGAQMVYYQPEAGVLLFGNMFNEQGENLTEIALAKATASRMENMDLSVALEFGPEDAPVLTEFSNPHCGYCQRLHDWLDEDMASKPVRRRIIFAVGNNRQAQDVAEHILCSKDKEQAFNDVYSRRSPRDLMGYARETGYTPSTVASTAAAASASTTQRSILDAGAYEDHAGKLAEHAGIEVGQAKELLAGYDHAVSTGRVSGANGKLEEVYQTSAIEEQQRMGTAAGARDASAYMDLSPGQVAKSEAYLNTLFSGGDVRFAEGATNGERDSLN